MLMNELTIFIIACYPTMYCKNKSPCVEEAATVLNAFKYELQYISLLTLLLKGHLRNLNRSKIHLL